MTTAQFIAQQLQAVIDLIEATDIKFSELYSSISELADVQGDVTAQKAQELMSGMYHDSLDESYVFEAEMLIDTLNEEEE